MAGISQSEDLCLDHSDRKGFKGSGPERPPREMVGNGGKHTKRSPKGHRNSKGLNFGLKIKLDAE
jgi:hypothetical protein